MSVRASSSGDAPVSRWRGRLSLTLGLVLGPVVALINQQAIYSADTWVCGHGVRASLHIIPVLCLIMICSTAFAAWLNWRSVGGGVEDERHAGASQTRFMALLGFAISVFSALVVLAQWIALFVFQPCMRA
jgi:hypothetical protein